MLKRLVPNNPGKQFTIENCFYLSTCLTVYYILYSYYYFTRRNREQSTMDYGGGPGKSTTERLRHRRRRSLANVSRRGERVLRVKVRYVDFRRCGGSGYAGGVLKARYFYLFDFMFVFLLFWAPSDGGQNTCYYR